ncbi:hypothetical protein BOW53_00365 [Solemya pervernicosa gill symbiont]|uniref:Uncharacterized protein n=1 Tax=Solemya pervernicosa gill symbiont TaxID=642797 RepID=A0A1T2LB54_9GAMM|nr:hypothetical protein [Solemya pervernicosa gill symbiont]OOZ42329.1 hypothetical protein BOW53_00365 [Solemya pervernicosa gill symbiont]
MKIAPPDDDLQLRTMVKSNEKSSEVHDVDIVEPYAPIKSTEERKVRMPREGEERRHAQRRREQQKVLLDTRDEHERRAAARRHQDRDHLDEEPEEIRPHGIDVEA